MYKQPEDKVASASACLDWLSKGKGLPDLDYVAARCPTAQIRTKVGPIAK
jgi:hypothetical protein